MNKQIVSFVLAIGTSVAMSASVFAADFTSSPSTEDISPKIEQYFSEIDQYMISHPELCKLDSANFTKTAEVPLSNGETATVRLENKKNMPHPSLRWSDTWDGDGFTDGFYTFTYTADVLMGGEIRHSIDYYLEKYSDYTNITIQSADIEATPIQFSTIADKGTTYDDFTSTFVQSDAYVTFEPSILGLSQPITVYSQITLDNASTGNNDIYVVATKHI